MRQWHSPLTPMGDHPLPAPWWLCLLLWCRGYWLLLLALASRSQSGELLGLVYPDPVQLYWALGWGTPALLVWLASAYRQRTPHPLAHALWCQGRPLCFISALGELGNLLYGLYLSDGAFSWPVALLLLAQLTSLVYLLRSRRLKGLFVVTAAEANPVRR